MAAVARKASPRLNRRGAGESVATRRQLGPAARGARPDGSGRRAASSWPISAWTFSIAFSGRIITLKSTIRPLSSNGSDRRR
jgi:hypothetical protein